MRGCIKHVFSRIAGLMLCAVLALGLAAGPMAGVAYADEYTYQATIYAGNHGQFGSALDIRVNNRQTGSGYQIRRESGDKIVISGLKRGDVVSVDVTAPGAIVMDSDSIYYVKGLRDSGMDNSEAGYGAFRVDRDRDFVVAYGMRSEETSYTVYYETADGQTLETARTYYGNVGDKPVAAYLYVEGYTPLAYNLTKTLSSNPAENTMTFLYVPEQGEDIIIHVEGPVIEDHVSGGTVTVNVPGPTIVQPQTQGSGTSQIGNQTVTGDNSQGGGQSDAQAGSNQGQDGSGQGQDSPHGVNQAQGTNQAQGGTNQAQDGANQGQGGTNQAQGDTNGSSDGGSNTGTNDSQAGGQDSSGGQNSNTGGNSEQGSGDAVNLPGIGTHGSRDDGTSSDGQASDASADAGGQSSMTEYKPGGSRDVVISSNYEPSQIVDLDENPSGVPMDSTPDINAGDDAQSGDYDSAQDSMNENQDGSGTGSMSPEESKGLPIVPIVIVVVLVLAAVAGGIFIAYKRQQNGGEGSEE